MKPKVVSSQGSAKKPYHDIKINFSVLEFDLLKKIFPLGVFSTETVI